MSKINKICCFSAYLAHRSMFFMDQKVCLLWGAEVSTATSGDFLDFCRKYKQDTFSSFQVALTWVLCWWKSIRWRRKSSLMYPQLWSEWTFSKDWNWTWHVRMDSQKQEHVGSSREDGRQPQENETGLERKEMIEGNISPALVQPFKAPHAEKKNWAWAKQATKVKKTLNKEDEPKVFHNKTN